MRCLSTHSRPSQGGGHHRPHTTSVVLGRAPTQTCRASPHEQCGLRNGARGHNLRTAATATATAAMTTLSPSTSEAHDDFGTLHVSNDPWLHQAIPGLVRQLSGHAAGCLQLISEPMPGRCAFTYKQLELSQSQSQQAWPSILSNCSPSTSAVILARPIPDPSQACPLCQPPSDTSGTTRTTSTACTQTGSTLQLQGSVDIDSCCSGSSITSTTTAALDPTHPSHSSPHHDHHHDTSLHASMQARARELVVAPVHLTDSQSSSSGSSGSEEEAPPPPPPSSSSATHKHMPRSRRRFLRRQQAAKVAAASGAPHFSREPLTSYYGLAVQRLQQTNGPDSQGAFNGCYVLKLSRNRDVTGCTCTVFSLTRVCSGQALHSQLQQSWLVQ